MSGSGYRSLTILSAIALLAAAAWLGWEHQSSELERHIQVRTMTRETVGLRIELMEIHHQLDSEIRSIPAENPTPTLSLDAIATRLRSLGELGRSISSEEFPPLPRLGRRAEWFTTLAERRSEDRDRRPGDQEITAIKSEYSEVYRALLGDLEELEESLRELEELQLSRSARFWIGLLAGSFTVLSVLLAFLVSGRIRYPDSRAESSLEQDASLRSKLHSQKMEAVGRLAGGIAHDLNNYLATVTANCELVRMDSEPESELATKMDRVISTSEKATALLRQLLNFSRQKPAMAAIVDLNRVVRGLDPMLRRLIGEDVALELDLAADLHSVEIDPSQMEQVVVNLVVNSREAMPAGGRILLSTRNSTGRIEENIRTSDLVVLSVADDGPGIPEVIRERIFEPYYSTKSGAGSSGLGLATVYGIATQNHGDVQLREGIGHGARFDVRLPRTEKTAVLRPSTRGHVRGASGRERILLVEDSEDLRIATAEMLERLGYGVRVADDGEQALQVFDEEPGEFELVISDVVMKKMGGPELATRIRERDPEVPVLLVSGYRDSTIFGRTDLADVEFLAKPFTAKVLDRRIRELLDGEGKE